MPPHKGYWSGVSGDALRNMREAMRVDQETFARAMGWTDRFTVMRWEQKPFIPFYAASEISDFRQVQKRVGLYLVEQKEAEIMAIKRIYNLKR